MPLCKTCGAELTPRQQKSKRAGETLFVCTGPGGHKNQGTLIEGHWHISQRGPHNTVRKGGRVNIREYQTTLGKLAEAGYSWQSVWDMGVKLALDIANLK